MLGTVPKTFFVVRAPMMQVQTTGTRCWFRTKEVENMSNARFAIGEQMIPLLANGFVINSVEKGRADVT